MGKIAAVVLLKPFIYGSIACMGKIAAVVLLKLSIN